MGDRTWTGIQFSGAMTRAVAEELAEELRGQGCQCDEGPEGDLSVEHLLRPHQQFYDDDCNYAHMEGVENHCREHGIAYLKQWSPGGDYGEGMQLFNGREGLGVGTIEGEPALTISQIKELGIGMLGYIDAFLKFEEHFPPVTIIEPETTEGETP